MNFVLDDERDKENGKVIFQINSPVFRLRTPSQSQSAEVLGLGEISIIKQKGLSSFTIESLFWRDKFLDKLLFNQANGAISSRIRKNSTEGLSTPINEISQNVQTKISGEGTTLISGGLQQTDELLKTNAANRFWSVEDYIIWLENKRDDMTPLRFTILTRPTEPELTFNMLVTIEDFVWEQRAHEEGDYYYEIEFKEFKDYTAIEIEAGQYEKGILKTNVKREPRTFTKPPLESFVTMKESEGLIDFAKKNLDAFVAQAKNEPMQTIRSVTATIQGAQLGFNAGLALYETNKHILSQNPLEIVDRVIRIPEEFIGL